jgi:ABC-type sugar transport system ATPase subunit
VGALMATMAVDHIERLGQESYVYGQLGGIRFGAVVDESAGVVGHGQQVQLSVRGDRTCFFDAAGVRVSR